MYLGIWLTKMLTMTDKSMILAKVTVFFLEEREITDCHGRVLSRWCAINKMIRPNTRGAWEDLILDGNYAKIA